MNAMLTNDKQEMAAQLAETIKDELAKLARIREAGSFSELHDYLDANCLGQTESVWAELTNRPVGDSRTNEALVQDACDVVDAAQGIVDRWIKDGGLR